MPKRNFRRRQMHSSSPRPKKLMPFSVVFPPGELSALRKIAKSEGVPIATLIRRAIHTVIDRVYPGFGTRLLESEANRFLDQLAKRFPGKLLTASKRKAFRNQLRDDLR